jgi:hypothetical protein
MERRHQGVFLLIIFLTPLLAPTVVADWDDDNWLWNLIGPERLEHGDEFACHGYEGIDINEDNSIISSCKKYLNGHTNSSRWGSEAISFGVPNVIDESTISSLKASNFLILGDNLQSDVDDMFVIQRNGGSIEKNAANITLLDSAEKDSLVSVYWEARIYDLKVREDKSAIEFLENQDVWYTTWGEWYNHEISSNLISSTKSNNSITISLEKDSNSSWEVPGSIFIETSSSVLSVSDKYGDFYPLLQENTKILQNGWRQIESGLLITISPGDVVEIKFDNESSSLIFPLQTFNDLHHSVTIVGHHVTNLHEWASDFYDSPLLFTWLIERPSALEMDWRLPIIALGVLIATPLTIKWLVKRDQNLTA